MGDCRTLVTPCSCWIRSQILRASIFRRNWDEHKSARAGLAFRLPVKTRLVDGVVVHGGSNNVFADLGLADAEKLKLKTGLMIDKKAICSLGMTQQEVAKRMGIAQSKASDMMRGDFTNLSERELMDCLTRLGYDMEIKVQPAKEKVGHFWWPQPVTNRSGPWVGPRR